MFIAALFTIAKICKESKSISVDEWIKKMWSIYTMRYYLAIKKNLAPCNNMDGSREYHAKRSKSEKDKHHMIELICGI